MPLAVTSAARWQVFIRPSVWGLPASHASHASHAAALSKTAAVKDSRDKQQSHEPALGAEKGQQAMLAGYVLLNYTLHACLHYWPVGGYCLHARVFAASNFKTYGGFFFFKFYIKTAVPAPVTPT